MHAIVEGGPLGASFFLIIIYALRKPHKSSTTAAALPRLTITCVLQVRVGDYANAPFVSALSLLQLESGAARSTPLTPGLLSKRALLFVERRQKINVTLNPKELLRHRLMTRETGLVGIYIKCCVVRVTSVCVSGCMRVFTRVPVCLSFSVQGPYPTEDNVDPDLINAGTCVFFFHPSPYNTVHNSPARTCIQGRNSFTHLVDLSFRER